MKTKWQIKGMISAFKEINCKYNQCVRIGLPFNMFMFKVSLETYYIEYAKNKANLCLIKRRYGIIKFP